MWVTFVVPEDGLNGEVVAVVSNFNHWDPMGTPLAKVGKVRSATLTLPARCRHAFRYLVEGGQWFNDAKADGYQHTTSAPTTASLIPAGP